MATEHMRALLDRLDRVSDEERQRLVRLGAANTSAPVNGEPRFRDGAAVIDLATGRRGVVRVAVRSDHTGLELYRVELVTGAMVYRQHDELEPDPTPAPDHHDR